MQDRIAGGGGRREVRFRGQERRRRGVKPCATIDQLMALLGGEIRFEILKTLALGPLDVSTLADRLDLSMPIVSHNLSLLREHALVVATRDKKRRIYALSPHVRIVRDGRAARLLITSSDGDQIEIHTRLPVTASATEVAAPDHAPVGGNRDGIEWEADQDYGAGEAIEARC